MPDDLVSRVAKAIIAAGYNPATAPAIAHAVIADLFAAMAEPSAEALDAGFAALDFDDGSADADEFNRRVCGHVWQAMLAQLRKEAGFE